MARAEQNEKKQADTYVRRCAEIENNIQKLRNTIKNKAARGAPHYELVGHAREIKMLESQIGEMTKLRVGTSSVTQSIKNVEMMRDLVESSAVATEIQRRQMNGDLNKVSAGLAKFASSNSDYHDANLDLMDSIDDMTSEIEKQREESTIRNTDGGSGGGSVLYDQSEADKLVSEILVGDQLQQMPSVPYHYIEPNSTVSTTNADDQLIESILSADKSVPSVATTRS